MATCSVLDPLSCMSSVAQSVAGDAFDAIAHDFATAAASAINWLWGQLSSSAAVQLGGQSFNLDLGIVAAIAGVVAVGLFAIQVIASILRRDASGLGRACKGLVVAFIAGGLAIGVTNLLLGAVDDLSSGVVQVTMGTDLTGMGPKILAGTAILQETNPALIILLAVATIAAVVVVWCALTVRKVLIVISAVFAPLAFAGSLADITVSWTRRWIEVMVALIVSKLILVIVFVVGWGVLDGAGQASSGATQTVTQTASGLLILGVAGLAPWMALKLVHFSGDQFHHLHSLAGTATSGAQVAAAAPQKVAAWGSTAGRLAAGAAGGGAAGGAAGGGAAGGAASGSTAGTGGPGASAGTAGTSSPASASTTAGAHPGASSSSGTGPGPANPPGPPPPTTAPSSSSGGSSAAGDQRVPTGSSAPTGSAPPPRPPTPPAGPMNS